jgi:type IV pilus assembly protein PilW
MLKPRPLKTRGFTILEVLIGLALGMVVITASLVVYSSTFSANSAQLKASKVNNELRGIMTQITRDLRRAGYKNWMVNWPADGNYLASLQTAPTLTTTSANITYDLNSSGGAAGADERFEFRWADTDADTFNDSVQSRIGGTGAWTNLNDPATVRIHTLDIANISQPQVNPSGAAAAVVVPEFEIVLGAVHVSPLCPPPQCMVGQTCPAACITRTIQETVRVRNPILTPN